MKFTVMLMVVAVAIAALSTFTTSEEDMEDGPLSIRSGSITRPPCNSLQTREVSFKALIKANPLTALYSFSTQFNCTQILYIGPADDENDYSGTVILLKEGTYLALDATYKREIDATWCGSGAHLQYPIIYSEFDGEHKVYCAVQCDASDGGIGYSALLCAGKPQDAAIAKDFLDTIFQDTLPYVDVQKDCPKPQHCYTFNY